jgi:hypothetical protein
MYSVAANSTIDVPLMDAQQLAANYWCQVAGSGTSAQRPSTPYFSQLYHDNTLGYLICWHGSAWVNPATGATV